ncbi:MAG: hypothetical protein N2C12_12200, partial [Planctomycetales bacterium]
MELREALSRIEAIQSQISEATVFRGYRSVSVGATGFFALAAAAIQAKWISNPVAIYQSLLMLWISVAAISALVVGVEMAVRRYS